MGAVEDILEWSASKLSPWRQDALRRLANGAAIGAPDHDDLLSLIKESAGFAISPKPAAPIALAKAHLSAVTTGASLQIKTIRNVTNVNRLMQSAALSFAIKGLTIIYGRNGSGKSGLGNEPAIKTNGSLPDLAEQAGQSVRTMTFDSVTDSLPPGERLETVANILAAGLLRLQSQKSSQNLTVDANSSLDCEENSGG